jgi:hypothetical protein
MGRAIFAELAVSLGLVLLVAGFVLIGVAAVQWTSHAHSQPRQRREQEREQRARAQACWESRTTYEHGYAIVQLVRVARWSGQELIINAENPELIPEENLAAISHAQIASNLRAQERNMNTRKE